ncbi:MAG: DUF1499 domain-containing protein [Planctomycetota bacterium]|nr:DUF1499 domain-containing protein [Planctomycetota bacterium]
MRKWLLLMLAGGLLFVAATLIVAQRPGELGLVDGALRRCSADGACVNSQFGEGEQRIAPLYVGADVGRAWQEMLTLLEGHSSVTVTARESHYLRIEWVQSILPYRNDLEFLRFDSGGLIHVRAAGRVGFLGMDSHLDQVTELSERLAGAMGMDSGF